jgi:hypothetical protein
MRFVQENNQTACMGLHPADDPMHQCEIKMANFNLGMMVVHYFQCLTYLFQ